MADLGRIAAYAGSGLLAGVGAGLVKAGEEKRERALREMEMRFRADEAQKGREFQAGESAIDREFRAGEAEAGRGFQAGEAELGREFQAGESAADRALREREGAAGRAQTGFLAGETFTDKDGKVWELAPGGIAKPVTDAQGNQIVGTPPRSAASDPLVKIKDEQGNPVWMPRSEAAGMEAYVDEDDGLSIELTPDEQAQAQAEAEANEKAGWTSTDASDFAEDGGSRTAFIARRKQEILDGKTSPGPAAGEGPPPETPPAAGEAEGAAGQPAGAGTKADPYKATAQAEIDWFKANAPAGAVIEVDGRLYTK
jgi:hypothetical protein